MTTEEARKIAEKVAERKKGKSWNCWDTLQLAWLRMLIKHYAKKGKRELIMLFIPRILVIKKLTEEDGFFVWVSENCGCIIRW